MDRTELRVGLVGHGFMGVVHSHAWQVVNRAFDLPVRARAAVLCGRDPDRTADAARRLGWDGHVTDWRDLVARDDVDVIDVCTPGDSHAEIVTAALAAGKHVLCEKPLSNTLAEADLMVDAAEDARARGVRSACAYNYRRLPAIGQLRELVHAGRLGEIRHVRASYLQDFFADPDVPLVWRMERERAGSGALGNLGSHVVDLVQHVTGLRFTGVSALTETFTRRRALPDGTGSAEVTVDDAALLTGRLGKSALATCETSWAATGHRNTLRLEVGGTLGAAAFDLDRLNELSFHDATGPRTERGFRRIMVTEPEHPHVTGWWPPGCAVGFDHPFTHEIRDFLAAIADDRDPTPSFADARQVQEVLDAATRSARSDSTWAKV